MNHRPSGYEPDELPDCSTPQQDVSLYIDVFYPCQTLYLNLILIKFKCLIFIGFKDYKKYEISVFSLLKISEGRACAGGIPVEFNVY